MFVFVCLLIVAALTATGQTQDLPSPFVDTRKFTGEEKPWLPMCCVIPKLIRWHFYFDGNAVFTTDQVSIDTDYFCDSLLIPITQLAYSQKHVHDCKAISEVIIKLVSKKILKEKARTTTSFFNKIVMAAFRVTTYKNFYSVPSSVVRALDAILVNKGLSPLDSEYIRNRISYETGQIIISEIHNFLERLELTDTLLGLKTAQKQIMTIINGTDFDVDAAVKLIKLSIKSAIAGPAGRSIESYKLRAYYIAFFKAVLNSVPQRFNVAVKNMRVFLSNYYKSPFTESEIQSIINAVKTLISKQKNFLETLLEGIEQRDKNKMLEVFPLNFNRNFISKLIDRLGWVNLRTIPESRNLLANLKDILKELAKYKNMMEKLHKNIKSRPEHEQRHHMLTKAFLENLKTSIQKELANRNWVAGHTTKAKQG